MDREEGEDRPRRIRHDPRSRMDYENRVTEMEKDLAAHVAECTLQHKVVAQALTVIQKEQHELRTIIVRCFVAGFVFVGGIAVLFLKKHLGLP